MSYDWQQSNPYDPFPNDRFYTSTPQPVDKDMGMTQNVGNGDNGYGMQRQGSASGSGGGSGSGSGRQTPLNNAPAPALGFYPNPSQPSNINDQYFPLGYSLDPNHHPQAQYRPSPLINDMSSFDASYQFQNGNGNGNINGHVNGHQSGQGGMEFQYSDYSVPPPRSSGSQPHSHDLTQYLLQPTPFDYRDHNGIQSTDYNNHGVDPNLNTSGHGADLIAQLMGNQIYGQYPQVLHEPPSTAQGTISPAQLGYVNKAFSSLVMSRGSSSSASSTEGGRDWTANTTPQLGDEIQTGSNLAYPDISHFPPQPSIPVDRHLGNGTSHMTGLSPETVRAIQGYFTTPNRLAYGERRLVIYTPKVGQKSYGTEKRFLCPHPLAILYGTSWWTAQGDNSPTCPIVPPSVNISLSGEEVIKDSPVTWTTVSGKDLSERINVEAILKEEQPFMGNVAGRYLHVSDTEGKRASFTALVRIRAPSALSTSTGVGYTKTYMGTEASEIIGTFESKEIKIISKPSKKKTNTKSTELVITHGSTIALYSRTKSQTASTRYLSVDSDLTNIRGSDGQHFPGAQPKLNQHQKDFPGLISSASVWESFIIWLADPNALAGPSGLPPLQPHWPSQPNNALVTGPVPPPIRYNALVILQSLQSGQCTPVMTIRRIDVDTDAVGQDGNVVDQSLGYAPEGEMLGDMVAQVQKVGMELYNPILSNQILLNRHSGDSRWLACDHENIIARHVQSERRWAPIPIPYRGGKSHSTPTTPARGFHILPMTPHTSSTNLPSTPSSPTSITFSSSSSDYFGINSRKSSSTHLISPISSNGEPLPMIQMSNSNDGGVFRRPRTGSTGRMGPLGRPAHKKRQSQDSHHATSASSSYDHLPNALGIVEQRQSWALSIGDVAVWTIVGTEQTSYTFYVPPTISVSDNPIAPYPSVTKYLPPGSEQKDPRTEAGFTPQTDLPLVHLYGKGFSKFADGPKYDVYYGNTKARQVEARCEECMAVSEPEVGTPLPCLITLVRRDGRSIIPTGLIYDHPPAQQTQLKQKQNQNQQRHNVQYQ